MDKPRKDYEPLDNKPIEFQITDIYIPENDRNKDKDFEEIYSIILYGVCNNGATISTTVKCFKPFFYIKPPEYWENYNSNVFEANVVKLKNTILNDKYTAQFKGNKYEKKIIPNNMLSHFSNISIVEKKDFWGFTNNKLFRFIKVSVKSLKLYNNLKYYFKSREKEGYKAYESNIDPFLKYIHIQNIKPCGWVRIEKYDIAEDTGRCNYNISVDGKNVIPLDINKIAPILITSFDIECTSSHGDFPVAIKNYSKVAQDLALVAKAGYEYTSDFIIYWLKNIYKKDIIIDQAIDLKINRVYTKRKISNQYIDSIPVLLEKNMNDIISILDKISASVKSTSHSEEDVEEIEEENEVNMTIAQLNEEETKLAKILDSLLVPLEGDKIIQIGTTVHIYGSEKIIYKSIITLDTCDIIEDCDVLSCSTEKELLIKWKELMNELNSDIVTGYNIFGFDMPYIWDRAKELGILEEYSIGWGRLITRKTSLVEQKLSSSAMGDNILRYIDMDGVVLIDLLKVMQREQKLDSYKLDNVASIFLGDNKNDLKPQEIFNKFKGNSKDRCEIAKYCIQDCCLVNRLIHKLKIIENNIGMGNVCLVPLNFLFRRGQGIKIFSLIAKQCMEKNTLIPTIKSYDNDVIDIEDGYEGAVVLDPKEAIYLNDPIVVFDYGSLYPSSMISNNLSHDCYLIDEKYRVADPNIEYKNIYYDIYEGKGDKKKKIGEKECTFVQYKDGRKGIIADILDMLLIERKNTRKKIEYKTIKDATNTYIGFCIDKGEIYNIFNIDTEESYNIQKDSVISIEDTYNTFEKDVLDSRQIAYKITREEIEKRRKEYYCEHIPKKIEEAMKMFTYSELGITTKKYMRLIPSKYQNNYMNVSNMNREHYLSMYEESTIDALEKINNSIYYDKILQQMIKQFKHYVVLSNNYMWQGFFGDFYRTIMIYYYVFIQCVLKYK